PSRSEVIPAGVLIELKEIAAVPLGFSTRRYPIPFTIGEGLAPFGGFGIPPSYGATPTTLTLPSPSTAMLVGRIGNYVENDRRDPDGLSFARKPCGAGPR